MNDERCCDLCYLKQISIEEENAYEEELQKKDIIIENFDNHLTKPLLADIELLNKEILELEGKVNFSINIYEKLIYNFVFLMN